MVKLFKNVAFICLLFLIFSGCESTKDDSHYKPSEFKHNVAINNTYAAIEAVELDLMRLTGNTPIDVVVNTYKDGITKMNEHLKNLEDKRKLLTEDKDLTRSEIKNWNDEYESSIKSVKNMIKKIEQKQEELMK